MTEFIIGGVAVAAVLVIVLLLVMRRRRTKAPVQAAPPTQAIPRVQATPAASRGDTPSPATRRSSRAASSDNGDAGVATGMAAGLFAAGAFDTPHKSHQADDYDRPSYSDHTPSYSDSGSSGGDGGGGGGGD